MLYKSYSDATSKYSTYYLEVLISAKETVLSPLVVLLDCAVDCSAYNTS